MLLLKGGRRERGKREGKTEEKKGETERKGKENGRKRKRGGMVGGDGEHPSWGRLPLSAERGWTLLAWHKVRFGYF